jgi:hypothetical protein
MTKVGQEMSCEKAAGYLADLTPAAQHALDPQLRKLLHERSTCLLGGLWCQFLQA